MRKFAGSSTRSCAQGGEVVFVQVLFPTMCFNFIMCASVYNMASTGIKDASIITSLCLSAAHRFVCHLYIQYVVFKSWKLELNLNLKANACKACYSPMATAPVQRCAFLFPLSLSFIWEIKEPSHP